MRYNIHNLLSSNPYPGRGIIIGCSEDGKYVIAVYFIMGRSENSRNRIFVKTDDGIRTAAFDESKMTDPSLIIYHPVRISNNFTIVTNGDQTDTILKYLLKAGKSVQPISAFHAALSTREFEPDAPNYTPRISGIILPDGAYALSVLKTIDNNPEGCNRCLYEYPALKTGLGHFVSTYETDGDPLPSFKGEPIAVSMEGSGDFKTFTKFIWDALNGGNKVSLYARQYNILTGEVKEIIMNKLCGD